MSLTITSKRLAGALLHLTLILFLITDSYCSPMQQRSIDAIDSSDLSGAPAFMAARSTSDSSGNFTFPTAFDTLGDNFTASSCPQFFTDFLADDTYQSCYPVSLLLQNSNSFFKDLASAVTLDEVLETSCSANVTTCSTFMTKLASNLTSSDNCGADYKLGNPVVTQAYDGMISYEPIATASCLEDPSTGDFCFTQAATNSSNISDYYLYFLPLDNSLPGGSRPTCNECTQATMAVFQKAAATKDSPLEDTYIPAAQTINVGCGPNYVNATIDDSSDDSSSSSKSAGILTATPPSLAMLLGSLFTISMGLVSIP
jgi:hypothetical protein